MAAAAAALGLHLALLTPAKACELPHPNGPVILTVGGMIGECNHGSTVRFDLNMLEALPARDITTTNPWDPGVVTYRGVLLRDLMKYVKAEGKTASVEALNDYHADITMKEMKKHDVILAYRRGGKTIAVRDKGPLFVVFPSLGKKETSLDRRYGQSVWQVHRIDIH